MRLWLATVLLAAMLPQFSSADNSLVERSNGMVEAVIDGAPVTIPAALASAVADAVAEHGNDTDSLAAALRSLVGAAPCDTASACESLAAAVVAFAVSKSNRQADVVEAIVQGVAAAVPAARTGTLLAAVGAADEPRNAPVEAVQTSVQAPRSASPTE
ncbi:MAG: hypothetical protein OXG51_11425 [Gammaproteobacteria bacterium]|nr:hypothetical protein [Gammaproteobacteria bacterium]